MACSARPSTSASSSGEKPASLTSDPPVVVYPAPGTVFRQSPSEARPQHLSVPRPALGIASQPPCGLELQNGTRDLGAEIAERAPHRSNAIVEAVARCLGASAGLADVAGSSSVATVDLPAGQEHGLARIVHVEAAHVDGRAVVEIGPAHALEGHDTIPRQKGRHVFDQNARDHVIQRSRPVVEGRNLDGAERPADSAERDPAARTSGSRSCWR